LKYISGKEEVMRRLKINYNIIKTKGDNTMKKTTLWIIVMAFIFSAAIIGTAKAEPQESESKTAPTSEVKGAKPVMPGQPMMIGNPMMMGGNPMMGGKHTETEGSRIADMLMRYVMGKQIIATSDGGVVVAIGNRLYKYDSNLNLQKDVEIPIDMEDLNKMTMNIKDFGLAADKKKKEEESKSKGDDETKKKE
jgi:hypothetical protein